VKPLAAGIFLRRFKENNFKTSHLCFSIKQSYANDHAHNDPLLMRHKEENEHSSRNIFAMSERRDE
jgi:hypothetical protein